MSEGNLSPVTAPCTSYSPDTGNPGPVCKRPTNQRPALVLHFKPRTMENTGLRRLDTVSGEPQFTMHAIGRRRRDLESPKRLVPRKIKVTKGGSGCETVSQNLYAFRRRFLTVRDRVKVSDVFPQKQPSRASCIPSRSRGSA